MVEDSWKYEILSVSTKIDYNTKYTYFYGFNFCEDIGDSLIYALAYFNEKWFMHSEDMNESLSK